MLAAAGTAALAALLAAPVAHAQGTTTAQGIVLDQDGNPVPDVQVLLEYKGHIPQKYRTKTDKKGRFLYVNVYSGPYDVTLSKEGLGEATMKDFVIRDLSDIEKTPTFRIGTKKAAPPPPGSDPTAAAVATAGVLAAEMQKGNEALAGGRLDEAQAAFEAVLAQAPNVAEAHHNLGLVYRRKGDLGRAEASFRKAAEAKPGFAEPHGALAVILAGAGKVDEALAEAEKAAAAAPQNAQYRYNLAVMYMNVGKSQEALDSFLEAEKLDPANAEIEYHLGTVLLGLNRVPEAIARLEKYVQSAPHDAANVGAAKALIAALQKKK
jgi:tetratricopeptide (TPR) repeat protein